MLLGGTGANAESVPFEAKRYKLVGVVTGVRGGAALLSINDQPAKPYAVGSRIDDANLLLAVGLRHVVLGGDVQRGSRQMLELNVE